MITDLQHIRNNSLPPTIFFCCLRSGSSKCIPHIHYEILEAGTNNFSESRKLGSGGFGSVYLCIMNEDSKTAVKRLYDSGAAIEGILSQYHQSSKF